MVAEFHTVFGHPLRTVPTTGTRAERELRYELIREELDELWEATGLDRPGCGDDDCCYGPVEPDLIGMADALADLVYVIYGAAHVFGIDLDACVREVHRSNMSKLGEDGAPIYREDGKVLKGPGYTAPDLRVPLGLA